MFKEFVFKRKMYFYTLAEVIFTFLLKLAKVQNLQHVVDSFFGFEEHKTLILYEKKII